MNGSASSGFVSGPVYGAMPEEALVEIIRRAAPRLAVPAGSGIDRVALLAAIAECESSFGAARFPQFEPAYAGPHAARPGGYYWKRSQMVKEAWSRFGAWAACSYSSFQVLYVTACEVLPQEVARTLLPSDLCSDQVAVEAVVSLANRRFFGAQKITTVEEFADAYNSGSARDAAKPDAYIKKFARAYRDARKRHPALFHGGCP